MQYKYLKEEADCPDGAHLNFETYGNLKSYIWRENRPTPPSADMSSLVKCNVAFGEWFDANNSLLESMRNHS